MALLSTKNITPQNGHFTVFRERPDVFVVNLGVDGSTQKVPFNRVNGSNDILSIVKFFIEFGGYNLSVGSLTVRSRRIKPLSQHGRNPSMGLITTDSGDLYIKKMNSSNIGCLMNSEGARKYDILVGIKGLIQIEGDPDYRYGIILEECFTPGHMTTRMIIHGLKNLTRLHGLHGFIHGDCSPENIMVNRQHELRLIDPCNVINQGVEWMRTDYYSTLDYDADLRAFIMSCFQIAATLNKCKVEDLYFPSLRCIGGLDDRLSNVNAKGCSEMIKASVTNFVDYIMVRFKDVHERRTSSVVLNYTRMVVKSGEGKSELFEGPEESDSDETP